MKERANKAKTLALSAKGLTSRQSQRPASPRASAIKRRRIKSYKELRGAGVMGSGADAVVQHAGIAAEVL
jgi:hypothetical protein